MGRPAGGGAAGPGPDGQTPGSCGRGKGGYGITVPGVAYLSLLYRETRWPDELSLG